MQGNLQKSGLQHFDEAKDLKFKCEGVFYIWILFWGHFRKGFLSKDMPCKRNSVSIGFIEVEIPNEGLTFWFKKMITFDNFSKIEIFKVGSKFQVKIHKKSNKSKKNFRCRSACRCRSRRGLRKSYFITPKKKWWEEKIQKLNFWDVFSIFKKERA